MVDRGSELVELCISRGSGIWGFLYASYVDAVWSKVLEFLYGAKWCFFRRIWKGVFVWGKVLFFSAKIEGIVCMGQGGVFFSEYGREFLYGAKWCVFRRLCREMIEMAVGSRNRTLEPPIPSTNCQVSVGTRTRIFKR
jgi:hypothetical protein